MKKILKKILLILCLVICIILFHYLFITKHKVTYKIKKYTIIEEYYKKEKDYYDMTISKGKQIYTYTINKNLNKQKKIINDIKTYQKNNLICIIPQYKKKVENNIYCNLSNQQVSVDYLVKTKNEDFQEIQKKVKKYSINIPNSSEVKIKYKNIEVYNENIMPNHIYYLWNYKGLYILENDNTSYQSILDYDLYDNILSCTVEDKFVLLENASIKGIENIYYYNPSQKKVKKIRLKKPLSKDSYINGVVENLIYITDRRLKKEYTLNIKNEQLLEINTEENYLVYQNGKRKNISKSDFFMEDQIFTKNDSPKKKVGNYTYYLEDNKIYKYLKKNNKHPILLLELENIMEWQVKGDEIILLREDTIYSYNCQNGLRKIVESNELNYNYKNTYQIGER